MKRTLCCAALVLFLLAAPVPGGERSVWEQAVRRAQTALDLGDLALAGEAIAQLERERPGDLLITYLRARVAESRGDWGGALAFYGEILTVPGSPWSELTAGRWVRAHRARAELRVHRALAAIDSVKPAPGRCLVLPLEPMILSGGEGFPEDDLDALGMAIASAVITGLAGIPSAEPIDLPTTLLLRRALVERRPVEEVHDPLEGPAAPPVTTLLGVLHRLASLAPAGPPPWAPDVPPANRYLASPPGTEWTETTARALAHFQSEQGLPASGQIDPETRQALERAFRASRRKPAAPPVVRPGLDISQAMGTMLGARAVLSGTLEPEAEGAVRWNTAWVSPQTGLLLSPTLEGVLLETHFGEAWARMIERILHHAPPCAGRCEGELAGEGLPNLEAALDFGAALILVEEGETAQAAHLFTQAAHQGADGRVTWYGRAWGMSFEEMEAREEALISESIYGPRRISAGLLRRGSWGLTGGLWRRETGAAALGRDPAMTFLPDWGWVYVTGSVE